MNQKGKQYLQDIENKKIEFRKKFPDTKIPKFSWSDSRVQERIMRLGREAKLFELETNDELETVAMATLIEDLITPRPQA